VSLRYTTTSGSATADSDFVPDDGLIQFAPGVTNQDFWVLIYGDTVDEPDEFFLVNLSDATNAVLAYSLSSGVILNDDGQPGKMDHFAVIPPATPIVQGQPAPFSVVAVDAWGSMLPGINTDFDLQCLRETSTDPVKVLTWTGCTDSTRYTGTLTAISNWFSAFHETTTTTVDPVLLNALLSDKQVFLVPAQDCGFGYLAPLGVSWADVLNRFVNRGGTIIVCSDNYDEHLLLANSGLLQLRRIGYDNSGSVTQAAPSSLTVGVSNSFSGPFVSTYEASNGVVVLKTSANGYAVVVQRNVGLGTVILIGSGFYSPGSQMEHVLANAVALRYDPQPATINVLTDTPFEVIGGAWTGHLTFEQAGTSIAAVAVDDYGRFGFSEPFDVLADRDGDGMPDNWEIANGLNPDDPGDRTADADADGMSNGAEFLAGTDPHDPSSALKIEGLRIADGAATVTFTTSYGRWYAVEATDGLQSGVWTPVSATLDGAGEVLEHTFVLEPWMHFFRIRLLH
jgi:hypothetical protein